MLITFILISSSLQLIVADLRKENSGTQPIVRTTYGSIKGIVEAVGNTIVHSFRGIPYAVPPIQGQRFRPPQPIKPWGNKILLATKYPPECPQKRQPKLVNDTDISFQPLTMSEDCLYLNVWTPSCSDKKCDDKKYPVFVFIHGGSFVFFSSSTSKIVEGKILAALGQVVVVTFNYRLGILGFLYSNHPDSPGNQALIDQQLAIDWVRKNIASFSGDPNSVTVAGESAGGISASIHYLNQYRLDGKYEHWVKRWIFSSGIIQPGFSESRESAWRRFKSIATQVGCNRTGSTNTQAIVSCLRSVSTESLLDAQESVSKLLKSFNPIPARIFPIIGVEPYRESIFEVLANTNPRSFHKTQVFITNMQVEGTVLAPLIVGTERIPKLDWYKELIRNNSKFFDVGSDSALNEIISVYFPPIIENDAYLLEYSFLQMIGDRYFNCPSLYLAEELTVRGIESHQGLFKYCNNKTDTRPKFFYDCKFGAQHGADVAFTFGIPFLPSSGFDATDRIFSGEVVRIWSNFVKTGQLPWSRVRKIRDDLYANYEYLLDIGLETSFNSLRTNPRRWKCQVLRPYIWSSQRIPPTQPKETVFWKFPFNWNQEHQSIIYPEYK